MQNESNICSVCGSTIINGRCVRFTQHPMPEKKREKFIGHAVRDDPNIDRESTRPIERRMLVSTDVDVNITLDNIGRTRRKASNFEVEQRKPDKIGKPLHEQANWETLKREIENAKKKK